MPAMLQLEAIGPRGEKLAMGAGDATGIPTGFDPDFECATFDADSLEPEELKATVLDALGELDPEWQSHLRVLEE